MITVPGKSRRTRVVGFVGELHPRWLQRYEMPSAAVVFEIDAAALMASDLPHVVPVSRFPTVVRDRAYVVDAGIAAGRVMDAIDVGPNGQSRPHPRRQVV